MRRRSLALALVVLGCARTPEEPSVPDYVGKDSPVEAASLAFVEPAERARFDRARACFAARGADWQHFGLRKIGNFIEEDWCTGPGAERGCSGGTFRARVGAQWASVGTLHYPQDWPEVFGVHVDVGRRAPAGAWSVTVSGSTNGRSVLGDTGHISLQTSDEPNRTVYLGTRYRWQIAQSEFFVAGEGDAWALLERVRQSPAALAEEVLRHWTALEAQVLGALARGEVLECVYGEYGGRGIPPECIDKVPLPAAKNAAEVQRMVDQMAWVRKSLADQGDAMHAALVAVAPPACF